MEEVDGRGVPSGWMCPGYDDSGWHRAVSIADNVPFVRGGAEVRFPVGRMPEQRGYGGGI